MACCEISAVKRETLVPRTDIGYDTPHMRAILVLRNRVIDEEGDTKGHHRHRGGIEEPYRFSTLDRLIADFQADIQRVKATRKESTE